MLDLYCAEPFEQQQFGTAGVEGVNLCNFYRSMSDHHRHLSFLKINGTNLELRSELVRQDQVQDVKSSAYYSNILVNNFNKYVKNKCQLMINSQQNRAT